MKKVSLKHWLSVGASALAMIAGGVSAHAQEVGAVGSDSANTASGDEKVVVVTARRKALQSAIEIKKNSDTIVDSVVADEAGNLPDLSVTEVLQRVSGVTVTRFATSNGGTPSFQIEGTGVTVRGLPYNSSTLNGRQAFSANGANGLMWNEVTPELMGGVDVYKASRADIIEGGSSHIDLRTRLPFDYKKPAFELNLGANYGDLSEKASGSISGLMSRRFDTKWGEMGLLVDLAHSEHFEGQDDAQMGAYLPENNPNVAKGWSYVPTGYSWSQGRNQRSRDGAYVALQWRPSEDLTLTSTAFFSQYKSSGYGRSGGWGVEPTLSAQNNPIGATYDSNGAMTSGSMHVGASGVALPVFGWGGNNWLQQYIPTSDSGYDWIWKFDWSPDYHKSPSETILNADCRAEYDATATSSPNIDWGKWGSQGMFYCQAPSTSGGRAPLNVSSGASASEGTSSTFDFTQSFVLNHENMRVKGALQFVTSKANGRNMSTGITQRSLDLTSASFDYRGDVPIFGGFDAAALANTDTAHFGSMSYNGSDNKGTAVAGNIDAQYSLSDDHFFKEISWGARLAAREERDNFIGTYWAPLARDWVKYPLPDSVNGSTSESRAYLTGPKAITGPYTVNMTIQGGAHNGQVMAVEITPYGVVRPSDYELYNFPNFFRGTTASPGAVLAPNVSMLQSFDWAHLASISSEATDDAINAGICKVAPDATVCASNPGQWTPQKYWDNNIDSNLGITNTSIRSKAFYVQTKFGAEGIGFIPAFTGNFGLRYVAELMRADGNFRVNSTSQAFYLDFSDVGEAMAGGAPGHLYMTPGVVTPRTKEIKYERLLPSFNIKFDVSPQLILRAAASQGASQANLGDIRAGGNVQPTVQSVTAGQNTTYYYLQTMTSRGAGSNMKPVMFTNADLSLEWYPKDGTYAYVDLFAKDIKNQDLFDAYYQIQPTELIDVTAGNVLTTVEIPWFYVQNRTTSANEKAKIRGLEIGGRTFFDFLPAPFDGFGVNGNFTFVDSENPALLANSTMGTEFVPANTGKPSCETLPVADQKPGNCRTPSNVTDFKTMPYYGMSRYSYNVEFYYSKGPFNARIAYNWHSKQLMSTNANPLSYIGRGGGSHTCTVTACVNTFAQGAVYDLVPLWSADAGYVDFSVDYKLNDHISFGVQANNLTDTKSKTIQEPTPGVFLPYDTYISDRRVSAFLRMRY